MTEERLIYLRKDAKAFLKKKGTKVAVQVGYGGPYIFAEKGDFIREVIDQKSGKNAEFINYDGEPESVFITGDVLHVSCGVY